MESYGIIYQPNYKVVPLRWTNNDQHKTARTTLEVWSLVFLRYMNACTKKCVVNYPESMVLTIPLGKINITPHLFQWHREVPQRTDDITASPQGLQSNQWSKGPLTVSGVRGQLFHPWIGCFMCNKNCLTGANFM